MKLLKKNEMWLHIVGAFLGTYGICYLGSLTGMLHASFTVMSVLLMVVVYGLLSWTKKNLDEVEDAKQRKCRIRYAAIVSFLFSVSMIMGYQLQTNGMTEYGVKGKGLILLRAICLTFAVFPFGNLLFQGIEKIGLWNVDSSEEKTWRTGAVFGISALAIFVCLIPVWLAYYPIIMSYDFHRQVNEAAKGFVWFVPYQPLIHTWVIWVFLQLGYLLGDLQAGMAGMALFQMLVYSLASGYACAFLYRIVKKKWPVIVTALFFGVFPLNSVLVICTTKDVLFSVLFLVFVLLLVERFFFSQGKKMLVIDVLLLVLGCIMMQFRSNAIYALAVFGVLWVILAAKKEKLRVLLLCVLLVAGGKGTSVLIKEALGTELSPFKVEMYSVPIQQLARVGYYHGPGLDEETRRMLDSYIPERLWVKYNAPLADTVKGTVGAETFDVTWDGHMGQLLSDWLDLGLRYPNEYIDAFLELTRGYWFLDDRSYAECLGYGVEGRMGVIYTYNSSAIENQQSIEHESKFPWLEEQLEKIVSGNTFYNWPVVSVLFKSAFYFWALFLVFISFIYLRQKKQAVLSLLLVVYMATMLLGPVVQMRYIFPIMVTLPVLVGLLFLCQNDNDGVKCNE